MEITEEHLAALRGVIDAPMPSSHMAVALGVRGLVDSYLHRVEINPLGRVALLRVRRGAEVRVSDEHHLPFLRGQTGKVTGVFRYRDGGVRVEVAFDAPGTWCFYETEDRSLMLRADDKSPTFEMGCIFDRREPVSNPSHDRNLRMSL